MIRCLLWGTGYAFRENYNLIKNYELLHKIKVYGITSSTSSYSKVGDYIYIEKQHLSLNAFDIVIIMSQEKKLINEIYKEALNLGIADHNIIPCSVLKIQGFDFNKYIKLKKNPPSIFAVNCWGGLTYNHLGLRFSSPFINMFENHTEYIQFLKNPKHYISCDLNFMEMRPEKNLKREYPVARCDDILLHFNHYKSFDEAKNAWERRKTRINWNNLFIVFYEEDPQLIEEFCKLPYEKKVCFTTYESNLKGVITLNYRRNDSLKDKLLSTIINELASGTLIYYDVLDLLLYNKLTILADF